MILSESDLINVARIRLPSPTSTQTATVWVSVLLDVDTKRFLNTKFKYANVKFVKGTQNELVVWQYEQYVLGNTGTDTEWQLEVNLPPLALIYAEWRRKGYGNSIEEFLLNIKGESGLSGVDSFVSEVPIGVVDGVNANYVSSFGFIPETLVVYVNGLKMKKVVDYQTSGNNNIQFSVSPELGDEISVQYFKI